MVASATDKNETDFFKTVERLVASLQDGHGGVLLTNRLPPSHYALKYASPPVSFDWVGDSIVVTAIDQDVDDRLKVGDEITEIEGRSIEANIASFQDRISAASAGQRRLATLTRLITGPKGSTFSFKARSQTAEEKEISLARTANASTLSSLREPRPEQGAEVAAGVLYMDLTRKSGMREFKRLLPSLANSDGIVFDVRGYAGFEYRNVISYLIDEPVNSPQWNMPLIVRPDRRDMEFTISHWKVKPKAPRLTQNIAFITDKRAISASETLLGIVEHYKLGEIVGEPTAGTNGDVNPFTVPCGFTITWTGLRVLKHDGSQHHGVGIQPTIPVSRTIEGIAAGKDEFLERAVDVLIKNIRNQLRDVDRIET